MATLLRGEKYWFILKRNQKEARFLIRQLDPSQFHRKTEEQWVIHIHLCIRFEAASMVLFY